MTEKDIKTKLLNESWYFTFDPADIIVPAEQISFILGYRNVPVPDMVAYTIDESLKKYKSLINPRAYFTILNIIHPGKQSISVSGQTLNTGPIISSHLRKSPYAAVFTATIGKDLETLAGKLIRENDYLAGYILDAIASESVEKTCDLMELRLSELAEKEGMSITNRYSPGYCNWHVSEQKLLFSLMPENRCGISLTESSLMIPVKSVSGVVGLGPEVKKTEYNCSFCGLENCYKKKEHV